MHVDVVYRYICMALLCVFALAVNVWLDVICIYQTSVAIVYLFYNENRLDKFNIGLIADNFDILIKYVTVIKT